MNIKKYYLALCVGITAASGSCPAYSRYTLPPQVTHPTVLDIGKEVFLHGIHTFAVQTVVSACWGILGTSAALVSHTLAHALYGPSTQEIIQQKKYALGLITNTMQLIDIKLQGLTDKSSPEHAAMSQKFINLAQKREVLLNDLIDLGNKEIEAIDEKQGASYTIF